MANSQTIEARLCAYIDGSLDDGERQSIEHHLDAHPQHRAMIRDLLSVRHLVGNLPHLPAPADLGEGLQGQIERSMLLGEDEPAPSVIRSHIRKMKQRVILVAVFMLAAGLSVLVLQLLRGASKPAHLAEIAPSQPLPELPVLPAAVPATQPVETAIIAPDTQPVAAESIPTTEPAASGDALADIGDELGMDANVVPADIPATQPDAIQAADAPTTLPTTLPAADSL